MPAHHSRFGFGEAREIDKGLILDVIGCSMWCLVASAWSNRGQHQIIGIAALHASVTLAWLASPRRSKGLGLGPEGLGLGLGNPNPNPGMACLCHGCPAACADPSAGIDQPTLCDVSAVGGQACRADAGQAPPSACRLDCVRYSSTLPFHIDRSLRVDWGS